ncbi:YdcF family protein [Niveispirillum sp. KHB5.9]|uniref:YdcF family protein n=1 Tax=Niveispirillum sp. KHB5.9 TaxID=3400269 RepID=UPI003A861EBC
MGFGLGKLFAAVTSPGNLLLLLLLAGLLLLACGRRRWGRGLLMAGALGLALIAATPLSTWVLLPLEQRFPAPDVESLGQVDGIIVLGGALMPVGSKEHGTPQLNREAERLTVLPGLMRRFPQARMVFTGGSGDPRTPDDREAPFVLALLADWGVDTGRITLEETSRNTWENAVSSAPLIGKGERWLLVTSAAHMPRSMGVFRTVLPETAFIAWPVSYNANRVEADRFGLNLAENLERMENAAHEWRGLLAYRLSGRIPAVLPPP